jgi:hypothetical protein
MRQLRNPVIPEETAKKLTYKCMVCQKAVEGFYGQHEGGGTCSRACERKQMEKPRYPGHEASVFEEKHGL